MSRTGLVAASRMTAEDARGARFTQQILGGYSAREVEAFRIAVARALANRETTEQELLAEIGRLNEARDAAVTAPVPVYSPEASGVAGERVLTLAQHTADTLVEEAKHQADSVLTAARQEAVRTVGEARHQADQVRAHAEQQAAEIIREATEQAEAERTRIISEASAESRRVASGFRVLGEEMGAHLHELAEQLAGTVAEWDGRARDAQAPAPGERAR